MNRYKIFLKSGETVEVEAESVIITSFEHSIRYDFVQNSIPRDSIKLVATFYSDTIYGWAELPEIKNVASIRKNLSFIQNMCDNNSTCDGCPFEYGNCYFYNTPSTWNIDDIMKGLEIAGGEDE